MLATHVRPRATRHSTFDVGWGDSSSSVFFSGSNDLLAKCELLRLFSNFTACMYQYKRHRYIYIYIHIPIRTFYIRV